MLVIEKQKRTLEGRAYSGFGCTVFVGCHCKQSPGVWRLPELELVFLQLAQNRFLPKAVLPEGLFVWRRAKEREQLLHLIVRTLSLNPELVVWGSLFALG